MSANPETPPGKIIARIAAGAALTISAGHVQRRSINSPLGSWPRLEPVSPLRCRISKKFQRSFPPVP